MPVQMAYAVPDWQRLERVGEESEARRHRRERHHARAEAREAVGLLEADRPDDFEQSGDEKGEPGHRKRGSGGGRRRQATPVYNPNRTPMWMRPAPKPVSGLAA